LAIFRGRVTEAGLLDGADLDTIDNQVATLIDESVALGEGGARPADADLTTDVYFAY
jgi:pyruvate dehydrogenase E1 component alpha subunit